MNSYKLSKINNYLYNLSNFKNIFLENVLVPFNIVNYNNKYYLTLEIDNLDVNNLKKIEDYIKLEQFLLKNKKIDNQNFSELEFISNLKNKTYKNKNYTQIKIRIKQSKNSFISKYYKNNNENSIINIECKKKYNCKLEIKLLWENKKNFGLIINLISIEDN